jgi:hypothetical protein
VSSSVIDRTARFRSFLQVCAKKSRNEELCNFNIDRRYTWEEVQEQLEEAATAYEKKGVFWKHPFRTAGRSIDGSTDAVQVRLEILPTEEYSSLVCEALILIFDVSQISQSAVFNMIE